MTCPAEPSHPIVRDEYRPTPRWTVTLPGEFRQRMEGGRHVLWRPGLTVWLAVWEDPEEGSPEERLRGFRARVDDDAFAVEEDWSGGLGRLGYRLTERRPEGVVHAWFGYAFAAGETMSVGIRSDDEADLRVAQSIMRSMRYDADAG